MSDNDTPRTDALHHRMYREHAAASKDGANFHGLLCVQYGHTKEALAHAGTLERELAAARAELADARREMRRYLPVLERVERSPLTWEMCTMGTGIATLNGYRKAAGVEG